MEKRRFFNEIYTVKITTQYEKNLQHDLDKR